jgi:hypothetical protein
MNALIILAGLYLFMRLADRLRLINWHTTRPIFVALYLAHILWALGVVYTAFVGALEWHAWFGLLAQALWLEVTKHNWLGGMPDEIKSRPADLGDPELEH